jgi:arylsulfatase A
VATAGGAEWPRGGPFLRRFTAPAVLVVASAVISVECKAFAGEIARRPNVVVILADDLGYGDVKCFNPDGKIATPNIDKLAAAGMRFTDAHSASAVCSPTRYGLLTGRYCWRTKLQSGVLGGLSPRLIEPGRATVASLLKSKGYATACVGKWHLGMDWALKPDKKVTELGIEPREQVFNVDYTRPIKNGPNSVGFDFYLGIAASLDMVPYTLIENDRLTADPTEDRQFRMRPGADRFTRKGPAVPGFEAAGVLPALTKTAVTFLDKCGTKRETPFFLYLPLNAPHTPIAPAEGFGGKSGLGDYADFVAQTDHAVGEVLAALDRNHLGKNTLVIFTSDNGCSPEADYPDLLKKGHNPSYVFRGTKADVYEGGHRVPFVARWPGVVKAGTASEQLVCLNDVFRTCAEVAGVTVLDAAGEDSYSLLPVLRGAKSEGLRQAIVNHSVNGSFAIREGDWKLCLCPGSGGWSAPRPGRDDASKLPPVQLFNLKDDVGEWTNLADKHPELVERLTKLLDKYVADGRSTPGAPQKNAVAVDVRKAGRVAMRPVKK